jgi:hypothetical protein
MAERSFVSRQLAELWVKHGTVRLLKVDKVGLFLSRVSRRVPDDDWLP